MPQSVTVNVDPATVSLTEDELQRLTPTLGSTVVERLRNRQQSGRYPSPSTTPGEIVAAKPVVVSKEEVINVE